MDLVDTHCHIHFPDYELDPLEVIKEAQNHGVARLLCVGCTLLDSKLAIEMAAKHEHVYAAIGLHPHEAKDYVNDSDALQQFRELAGKPKVVAIGETGLDYHYTHSSKEDQKKLFRFQLDLAVEHDLPLIFHVREAFDDFFGIIGQYQGLRGVVHSFTANRQVLDKILSQGLYIGLNGIITFAKDEKLLDMVKVVPLDRLLLETDAPFLTPTPFRGKVCEPKYVRVVAEFLADLRGEPIRKLANATTQNARALFNLNPLHSGKEL